LHNEELHGLYSSPDIYGDKMNVYMSWECSRHGRDEKCMRNI